MSEKSTTFTKGKALCYQQRGHNVDSAILTFVEGSQAARTAALAKQIVEKAQAANAEHPLIKHFNLFSAGLIEYGSCVLLPISTTTGSPASFVQVYRNGHLRLLGEEEIEWERKA